MNQTALGRVSKAGTAADERSRKSKDPTHAFTAISTFQLWVLSARVAAERSVPVTATKFARAAFWAAVYDDGMVCYGGIRKQAETTRNMRLFESAVRRRGAAARYQEEEINTATSRRQGRGELPTPRARCPQVGARR